MKLLSLLPMAMLVVTLLALAASLRGGGAAFVEEPLEPWVVGPGDGVQEKLYRDVPVQHPVPTQINHAHSAATNLANEPYRAQLARDGDSARGRFW